MAQWQRAQINYPDAPPLHGKYIWIGEAVQCSCAKAEQAFSTNVTRPDGGFCLHASEFTRLDEFSKSAPNVTWDALLAYDIAGDYPL